MTSPFTPASPTGLPPWTDASATPATWTPTLRGITQVIGSGYGVGPYGAGGYGVGQTTVLFIAALNTQWTPFTKD